MPIIPFESLPPSSRIWIFASDRALDAHASRRLLEEADAFLERWHAHGEPLRSGRQFSEDRFLVVGVDPTTSNASGCSLDGLFRAFRALEPSIGAQLLGGGRVFYRDEQGSVRCVTREDFARLAGSGAISGETPVFDTSLTTAEEFREGFERPAGETWTADLMR